MRTAMLVLAVVTLAIVVPAAVAPVASATHSCVEGAELLCTHPETLFCLSPLNKWLGFLCPYP